MSKVLIGNFKGPQGEQGIPGIQGEQGERGNRGSRWTEGTAITGTSTTPTVFSGTGISDALAEDMYLNKDTGNAYRCTTGGVATVAKWVYACNLKGIKGDTGAKGDPGTAGPKGEKGNTGEQGPKGDTPTVADNMTVAFTQASSRSNIATGEKLSVIMGKIKKFFADLTAPAFAQMITTKEDLLATKVTGYVPDAKAVADTYTELNSKLNNIKSEWIYLYGNDSSECYLKYKIEGTTCYVDAFIPITITTTSGWSLSSLLSAPLPKSKRTNAMAANFPAQCYYPNICVFGRMTTGGAIAVFANNSAFSLQTYNFAFNFTYEIYTSTAPIADVNL